jgi:F-type H+-transporting ATPase subunit beta
VIDLLAPIPRNGLVHFISSWGLGRIVLLSELMRNLAVVYRGYTVFVGVEERPREWLDVMLQLRACGIVDKVVSILVQVDDPAELAQQAMLTGLTMTQYFRDRLAREVIFIVDQRLLTGQIAGDGVQALAGPPPKGSTLSAPDATIGSLTGDLRPQLEAIKQLSTLAFISGFLDDKIDAANIIPPDLLDGKIIFSRNLADQDLYPAVDPLASHSKILKPEIIGETHFQVAQTVRQLLQHELERHKVGQAQQADKLPDNDRRLIARARRIQRFLTQPLFTAQLATAIPGEYVKREETITGCQALSNGQYDHLPEAVFSYIGAIDQALKP